MLVIKVGGALGPLLPNICADIVQLVGGGETVVLVHGGSAEASALAQQLGHPPRYLTGADGARSRYTDATTLDILTMALAGRVKPRLVEQLARLGVRAVGLTGLDGGLVTAQKPAAVKALVDGRLQVVRDDFSGRATALDPALVRLLLQSSYVPVISPPVLDPRIGALNSDADRLAALLAVALGADQLIVLSNVPGLLRDPADPASLVRTIPLDDFAAYLPLAQGRMRVKLLAAAEALSGGVARVVLGDGRRESPVRAALDGHGTLLAAALTEEITP